MNEQTELLREMCDLLRLIAEPQIAKRDERLRAMLLETVGKSKSAARAVTLMDGSRSQALISKEAKIDPGALSRLGKSLRGKGLLSGDDRNPKLRILIPTNFFQEIGL